MTTTQDDKAQQFRALHAAARGFRHRQCVGRRLGAA